MRGAAQYCSAFTNMPDKPSCKIRGRSSVATKCPGTWADAAVHATTPVVPQPLQPVGRRHIHGNALDHAGQVPGIAVPCAQPAQPYMHC